MARAGAGLRADGRGDTAFVQFDHRSGGSTEGAGRAGFHQLLSDPGDSTVDRPGVHTGGRATRSRACRGDRQSPVARGVRRRSGYRGQEHHSGRPTLRCRRGASRRSVRFGASIGLHSSDLPGGTVVFRRVPKRDRAPGARRDLRTSARRYGSGGATATARRSFCAHRLGGGAHADSRADAGRAHAESCRYAVRGRHADPADRMHQRGRVAGGARGGAEAGVRDSNGSGRGQVQAGASMPHGESGRIVVRRRPGTAAGGLADAEPIRVVIVRVLLAR